MSNLTENVERKGQEPSQKRSDLTISGEKQPQKQPNMSVSDDKMVTKMVRKTVTKTVKVEGSKVPLTDY